MCFIFYSIPPFLRKEKSSDCSPPHPLTDFHLSHSNSRSVSSSSAELCWLSVEVFGGNRTSALWREGHQPAACNKPKQCVRLRVCSWLFAERCGHGSAGLQIKTQTHTWLRAQITETHTHSSPSASGKQVDTQKTIITAMNREFKLLSPLNSLGQLLWKCFHKILQRSTEVVLLF